MTPLIPTAIPQTCSYRHESSTDEGSHHHRETYPLYDSLFLFLSLTLSTDRNVHGRHTEQQGSRSHRRGMGHHQDHRRPLRATRRIMRSDHPPAQPVKIFMFMSCTERRRHLILKNCIQGWKLLTLFMCWYRPSEDLSSFVDTFLRMYTVEEYEKVRGRGGRV